MEPKAAPHLQMSDDEIKSSICEMSVSLHSFKIELESNFKEFERKIELMENKIYRLKRHFCPDRFQELSVTLKDLNEFMSDSYFNHENSGETQKNFKQNKEENDPAT